MHRHQSQKTTGKRARRVVSSSPSHQRSITTSSTLQTLSAASSHARVMASASHHGSGDAAHTQQMRRGITTSSRVSPKATTGTSSVVTRRRLLDHDHHDQQQQHLHQHVATFSTAASSSSTIHPPTINENLLNASPASLKQSVVQRPAATLHKVNDNIIPTHHHHHSDVTHSKPTRVLNNHFHIGIPHRQTDQRQSHKVSSQQADIASHLASYHVHVPSSPSIRSPLRSSSLPLMRMDSQRQRMLVPPPLQFLQHPNGNPHLNNMVMLPRRHFSQQQQQQQQQHNEDPYNDYASQQQQPPQGEDAAQKPENTDPWGRPRGEKGAEAFKQRRLEQEKVEESDHSPYFAQSEASFHPSVKITKDPASFPKFHRAYIDPRAEPASYWAQWRWFWVNKWLDWIDTPVRVVIHLVRPIWILTKFTLRIPEFTIKFLLHLKVEIFRYIERRWGYVMPPEKRDPHVYRFIPGMVEAFLNASDVVADYLKEWGRKDPKMGATFEKYHIIGFTTHVRSALKEQHEAKVARDFQQYLRKKELLKQFEAEEKKSHAQKLDELDRKYFIGSPLYTWVVGKGHPLYGKPVREIMEADNARGLPNKPTPIAGEHLSQ